ncbi:MAG: hypothetical protein ACRDC4_09720 [Plesiomonas sp.]
MTLTPGKSHLTTLDILLEPRCWLADNVQMQAAPAIVAHLPNGYQLTQADCVEAIDALALLEKAVAKARDDPVYAKLIEKTLLQGSTVEIRECLSCLGYYFERSRDAPPYYPHHDAVNGIDCALYAILFDAAHPDVEPASIPKPGSSAPTP